MFQGTPDVSKYIKKRLGELSNSCVAAVGRVGLESWGSLPPRHPSRPGLRDPELPVQPLLASLALFRMPHAKNTLRLTWLTQMNFREKEMI